MNNFEYKYNAKVIKVYDGDTITIKADLGFKVSIVEKIRLYGINTPEVRGIERKDGLVSRDFLRDLILNKEIVIETIRDKKGKYGRYLGVVWYNGVDINKLLVDKGYAVYKEY